MKRLAKTLTMLLGVGAAVAAALWLLRDRVSGPPVEPVRSHDDAPRIRTAPETPAPAAPPVAAPSTSTAVADDLAAVNGIGPVYKRRLAAAGITTFAALAAASPSVVAEAVDAPESFAEDWIAQARDLAG